MMGNLLCKIVCWQLESVTDSQGKLQLVVCHKTHEFLATSLDSCFWSLVAFSDAMKLWF